MILGIGSDLSDIRRVEKSLARFGDRFTHRCFTEIERARSERKPDRASSYAKRFAAKEACAKALGTGMRRGDEARSAETYARLRAAAAQATALGLEVHAGHGLDYATVGPIAAIPEVMELNIGHFLIGEAIFTGLDSAIRRMRALMDAARKEAAA